MSKLFTNNVNRIPLALFGELAEHAVLVEARGIWLSGLSSKPETRVGGLTERHSSQGRLE